MSWMKLHLNNQNIRNDETGVNTRPGSIGTISADPVLLTQLGLVLEVLDTPGPLEQNNNVMMPVDRNIFSPESDGFPPVRGQTDSNHRSNRILFPGSCGRTLS